MNEVRVGEYIYRIGEMVTFELALDDTWCLARWDLVDGKPVDRGGSSVFAQGRIERFQQIRSQSVRPQPVMMRVDTSQVRRDTGWWFAVVEDPLSLPGYPIPVNAPPVMNKFDRFSFMNEM